MAALPRLWREPPIQLPPAPAALEFALRPSRLARRAAGAICAALLLQSLELAAAGQWIAASAGAVLGTAFAFACRTAQGAPRGPRRLLLASNGRAYLLTVRGRVEPVQVEPATMRLGPFLLLLLRGRRRYRLLLGPDNLEPAALAALNRRLGTDGSRSVTALHSSASSDPGSRRLP